MQTDRVIKHKKEVILKIKKAVSLIPKIEKTDLPFIKDFDVPQWYNFESKIWKIGEEIRQIILKDKNLLKDKEIQNLLLSIVLNKRAKRGRQSFILLLGSKSCQNLAKQLISQINDIYIDGQIIYALRKMKAFDFKKEIKPYCLNKKTWIRNEAKKYIELSDKKAKLL